MVKNLRLSICADPFLDYTVDQDKKVVKEKIFERRADLFVFGACYGKRFGNFDENVNVTTGKVKDPIRFHIFQDNGLDAPLAIIAYVHFGGDMEKFKNENECRKVLEIYSHIGLEMFYKEIQKHKASSAEAITNVYRNLINN